MNLNTHGNITAILERAKGVLRTSAPEKEWAKPTV